MDQELKTQTNRQDIRLSLLKLYNHQRGFAQLILEMISKSDHLRLTHYATAAC